MYKFHKRKNIVPENVKVTFIGDRKVLFSGPKGDIEHIIHNDIFVELLSNELVVTSLANNCSPKLISKIRSLINTTNVLFRNYLYGVVNYFECSLILKGIGYKASVKDNVLEMLLGYSHPVKVLIPYNIFLELPSQTEIVVKGVSKCKVGEFSASIRSKRVPEVYKGNGIRYKDELIVLKEPKKNK